MQDRRKRREGKIDEPEQERVLDSDLLRDVTDNEGTDESTEGHEGGL
jgi:hypothetical protein